MPLDQLLLQAAAQKPIDLEMRRRVIDFDMQDASAKTHKATLLRQPLRQQLTPQLG